MLIDFAEAVGRADLGASRAALGEVRELCEERGYVVPGSRVRSMLSELDEPTG